MAKAYNLTFDYILYKMSFANVRLYNAVLPSFSAKKDGKKDTGIILNGDDPNNQDAVYSPEISRAGYLPAKGSTFVNNET